MKSFTAVVNSCKPLHIRRFMVDPGYTSLSFFLVSLNRLWINKGTTKRICLQEYQNSNKFTKYIWQKQYSNITPLDLFAKHCIEIKVSSYEFYLTGKLFIINKFTNDNLQNKKYFLVDTSKHNKFYSKDLKRSSRDTNAQIYFLMILLFGLFVRLKYQSWN